MISLVRRRYFLVVLFLALIFSAFSPAWAYPGPIRQFLQEGKELRVKILEQGEEIELIAQEDLELKSLAGNLTIKLQQNLPYILKVEKGQEREKLIQVFASHNYEQALQVQQKLLEQGFQDSYILESGDWYKVQFINFTEAGAAEKLARELEAKGWPTWVKEVAVGQFVLIHPDGKRQLINNTHLLLEGKLATSLGTYQGLLEFYQREQGFDLYLNTELSNLLLGLLARDAADQDLSSPFLKAQAVFWRTYLLQHLIYGQGSLFLNNFPGSQGVNKAIIEAVQQTTGQVMVNESGELPQLSSADSRQLPSENQEKDYLALLGLAFPSWKVLDWSAEVEEELVVDATVTWGLKYQEIRQLTWWGPRIITLLDLDLTQKGLQLLPVLARGTIPGLEDLSQMVIREQALAGINGGYFTYTGRPLGLLYLDGQMLSEPIKNRTALGITASGEILIDQVSWHGELQAQGLVVKLTGVNRQPQAEEAVLLNSFFGQRAPQLQAGTLELLIQNQRVVAVKEGPQAEGTIIPEEGFLIQARGSSKNQLLKIGINDKINYRDVFTPDWKKQGLIYALGAGPTLIKGGRVHITAEEEEFQADIRVGRAPRSALGVTLDKHLLLVTVDGRQPEKSIGISLEELAAFLLSKGAVEAMNLDGGNSARMVVRGLTMNNPSGVRLISNGLIIYDRRRLP